MLKLIHFMQSIYLQRPKWAELRSGAAAVLELNCMHACSAGRRIRDRQLHQTYTDRGQRHHLLHPAVAAWKRNRDPSWAIAGSGESSESKSSCHVLNLATICTMMSCTYLLRTVFLGQLTHSWRLASAQGPSECLNDVDSEYPDF